ncbi:hypothetical protein CBR_g44611 [Chara braunii]|uniref:DNL-type domain-containing protein n=1 Tax=Chara braunii TaxID=69332 RepID=A0A388LY23_CHABU|nr:hypothetical protein CBR_g44611 [Chara braunii]|eukprot:GBG87153.1 hypothetical protein CBR_g44611 [Chara braunii]
MAVHLPMLKGGNSVRALRASGPSSWSPTTGAGGCRNRGLRECRSDTGVVCAHLLPLPGHHLLHCNCCCYSVASRCLPSQKRLSLSGSLSNVRCRGRADVFPKPTHIFSAPIDSFTNGTAAGRCPQKVPENLVIPVVPPGQFSQWYFCALSHPFTCFCVSETSSRWNDTRYKRATAARARARACPQKQGVACLCMDNPGDGYSNSERSDEALEPGDDDMAARLPSLSLSDDADVSSLAGHESESEPSSTTSIQITLPRRRLLVSFTCNLCGARSQRMLNPHAYRRGTVFVQCAGCGKFHQLVDNLGLIREYDFRGESVGDVLVEEEDGV